MIKGSVDRIENDLLVIILDNHDEIHVSKDDYDFAPGDVVTLTLSLDKKEMKKRKGDMKNLQDQLFGPRKDI